MHLGEDLISFGSLKRITHVQGGITGDPIRNKTWSSSEFHFTPEKAAIYGSFEGIRRRIFGFHGEKWNLETKISTRKFEPPVKNGMQNKRNGIKRNGKAKEVEENGMHIITSGTKWNPAIPFCSGIFSAVSRRLGRSMVSGRILMENARKNVNAREKSC